MSDASIQYENSAGNKQDLVRFQPIADKATNRKGHNDELRRAMAGFLAEQRKSRESIVQSGFFLSGIHRAITDSSERKQKYKSLGIDANEAKKLVAISQVAAFSDDALTMKLPHKMEHLWALTQLTSEEIELCAGRLNLISQNMTATEVRELVRLSQLHKKDEEKTDGLGDGFIMAQHAAADMDAESKNTYPDGWTKNIDVVDGEIAFTEPNADSTKPAKRSSKEKSYLKIKVDIGKLKDAAALATFKQQIDNVIRNTTGASVEVLPKEDTIKDWKYGVSDADDEATMLATAKAEIAEMLKAYDALQKINAKDAQLRASLKTVTDAAYKRQYAADSKHRVFQLLDSHKVKPRKKDGDATWTADRKTWIPAGPAATPSH